MAELIPKITAEDIAKYGVEAAPDRLEGNARENKMVFDRLVRELVAGAVNGAIDALNQINVSVKDWSDQESQRVQNEEERKKAEATREENEQERIRNEEARLQIKELAIVTETLEYTEYARVQSGVVNGVLRLSLGIPRGRPGQTGSVGPAGADGKTPVRGRDYWTKDDQAAIVSDVLEALPAAEEASF